jgi:hypothetical protein
MSKQQPNVEMQELYGRLQTTLASIQDDVLKSSSGNASAGVRARKGLRLLKKEAHELIRLSTEETKQLRAAKKQNA